MPEEKAIQIVINTLGQIEVHGKRNLDLLLGSIIALERLIARTAGATNGKEEPTDGQDH